MKVLAELENGLVAVSEVASYQTDGFDFVGESESGYCDSALDPSLSRLTKFAVSSPLKKSAC